MILSHRLLQPVFHFAQFEVFLSILQLLGDKRRVNIVKLFDNLLARLLFLHLYLTNHLFVSTLGVYQICTPSVRLIFLSAVNCLGNPLFFQLFLNFRLFRLLKAYIESHFGEFIRCICVAKSACVFLLLKLFLREEGSSTGVKHLVLVRFLEAIRAL